MSMHDPVSDMITIIRNGVRAKCKNVNVIESKFKSAIAKLMLDEGYIKDFNVVGSGKKVIICIDLKYSVDGESVISGIRRISRPGMRKYVSFDKIPIVLSGLGVSLISTSKGLLSDNKARDCRCGGEIICDIW